MWSLSWSEGGENRRRVSNHVNVIIVKGTVYLDWGVLSVHFSASLSPYICWILVPHYIHFNIMRPNKIYYANKTLSAFSLSRTGNDTKCIFNTSYFYLLFTMNDIHFYRNMKHTDKKSNNQWQIKQSIHSFSCEIRSSVFFYLPNHLIRMPLMIALFYMSEIFS